MAKNLYLTLNRQTKSVALQRVTKSGKVTNVRDYGDVDFDTARSMAYDYMMTHKGPFNLKGRVV